MRWSLLWREFSSKEETDDGDAEHAVNLRENLPFIWRKHDQTAFPKKSEAREVEW